ncbi:MAG: acyltransferase [Alphaproteobacteria bacterium]|nr:acyltransferase [Alphaproteobacteria bacterium]
MRLGALAALPQGPKIPEKWQGVASTAGLLGMVASFVLFRAGIPHPGPWALVPCIATWLVIVSPAFNAKIFAQFERAGRLLSYTGRISYHLYLFHYPLIVFGLYVLQRDMNVPEKLIVMAVTFALAMISYSYIERPVRAAKSPVFLRRAGIVMALLVLTFGLFGTYAYQSKGIKGRFPSLPQGLLDGVYAHLDPRHASCMDKDPAEYPGNLCRIGTEKAEPDTLLWGDSHALMYMPVVEAAAKEEGHSVLVAGISNCPPVPGLVYFEEDNRRNHRDCPVHNKALMDYVLKTPSLHTVILGGFWLNRIYDDPGAVQPVIKPDYILERGAAPDPNGRAQQFFEALSATILTLEKAGKHVVLIGPIPAYDFDVPQRLGQALLYGNDKAIGLSGDDYIKKYNFVFARLIKLMVDDKGFFYIDSSQAFCHDEFCYAAENDQLLYADKSHMERLTTMRLKSQFLKALQ